MDEGILTLLARKALLFNLSQNFRMISLEVDENNVLNILIAAIEEPSVEEKTLACVFGGNIKNNTSEVEGFIIDFIVNNESIDKLPRKKILIHALNE